MTVRSAGILLWRRQAGDIEVLIAHMGGPFWARKDEAAWSIPKGEYDETEEPLVAALREWREELGVDLPVEVSALIALGELRQFGKARTKRHERAAIVFGRGEDVHAGVGFGEDHQRLARAQQRDGLLGGHPQ